MNYVIISGIKLDNKLITHKIVMVTDLYIYLYTFVCT